MLKKAVFNKQISIKKRGFVKNVLVYKKKKIHLVKKNIWLDFEKECTFKVF